VEKGPLNGSNTASLHGVYRIAPRLYDGFGSAFSSAESTGVGLYVRTVFESRKRVNRSQFAGQSTWSGRSISIGCAALEPRHCRHRNLKNLPKEKGDQVGPSDIRTNAIGAPPKIADRIKRVLTAVSPDRVALSTDCGMKPLALPHPNVPHRRNSGGPHRHVHRSACAD
jgi:hypothetical protein